MLILSWYINSSLGFVNLKKLALRPGWWRRQFRQMPHMIWISDLPVKHEEAPVQKNRLGCATPEQLERQMLSQIMVKSVKSVKKNYDELCIYYTPFSYLWKGSRKGHSAEALFESELSIPCARTKLAHKDETMEAVKPSKFSCCPGASLFSALLLDIVNE